MVGFLPIIIPHQPSCFVLFRVVGWIVAIKAGAEHYKLSPMPDKANGLISIATFLYFQYFC